MLHTSPFKKVFVDVVVCLFVFLISTFCFYFLLLINQYIFFCRTNFHVFTVGETNYVRQHMHTNDNESSDEYA